MFVRERKKKLPKATANGVYTVGKSQFKLKKGSPIPERAENVIYRDEEGVLTAHDLLTARLNGETTSEDAPEENTSEDVQEKTSTRKTTKKAE